MKGRSVTLSCSYKQHPGCKLNFPTGTYGSVTCGEFGWPMAHGLDGARCKRTSVRLGGWHKSTLVTHCVLHPHHMHWPTIHQTQGRAQQHNGPVIINLFMLCLEIRTAPGNATSHAPVTFVNELLLFHCCHLSVVGLVNQCFRSLQVSSAGSNH